MQAEEIIDQIQGQQDALTSFMLNDLIKEHKPRADEQRKFAKRYRQKGLPIQTHQRMNPNKIDERVPNDFYSDIVDTKTGYMGNEVTVELDKERYGDDSGRFEQDSELLEDFQTLNDAVDQNSETVKVAARDGGVFRLLYIPEGRTEIRMKLVPAWEGIMIRDESLDEPVYFLRYWKIQDKTPDGSTERTVVEWYDNRFVTYYISTKDGRFVLDVNRNGGQQPHLFPGVPVVDFRNNEESQAEPEKVIGLIDAYDKIVSATVSEVEQLRLAYLALKDSVGQIDDEFMRKLEQTGIFPLGPEGDAKFITKDMAVAGVKIILDELRTNIYEFARSIDLSKDFGGDLRVIGWQVALLNLENSCKVTERKFKKALREQYRMVTDKWREWGLADVDYLGIQFTFTRNFPKDVGSEAKILGDLIGIVSRRTAYSLMSFIDNPDAEIEAFEQEREANMDLFGVANGDEESSDESEESDEADAPA